MHPVFSRIDEQAIPIVLDPQARDDVRLVLQSDLERVPYLVAVRRKTSYMQRQGVDVRRCGAWHQPRWTIS